MNFSFACLSVASADNVSPACPTFPSRRYVYATDCWDQWEGVRGIFGVRLIFYLQIEFKFGDGGLLDCSIVVLALCLVVAMLQTSTPARCFAGVLQSPTLQGAIPIQNLQAAVQTASVAQASSAAAATQPAQGKLPWILDTHKKTCLGLRQARSPRQKNDAN